MTPERNVMRLLGKIAQDKSLPATITERDLRIELARQKRELDGRASSKHS